MNVDSSPDGYALNDGKKPLVIAGCRYGFQKVEFTKMLKLELGYSLIVAKNVTDQVVDNHHVKLLVPEFDYERIALLAAELGAVVNSQGIAFPTKPGIIAYLTAGDPDLATTREIALAAIDNGADVIELGVPFSDPLADGPVIQRASERAVARGVRLTDVLALAKELRAARPSAGLVLFSYLNPVVKLGMKSFCEQAAAAGVDGVLLTDMIVEEATEYLTEMRRNQLAPIFLAAPTSPDKRLKAIAEASLATGTTGFVYAISRVGITGTQQQVAGDAADLVARLRKFTALPIAVGFGISNADHVAAIGKFADAAIIGSALVALIEKSTAAEAPAAIGSFIRGLREGVPVAVPEAGPLKEVVA